MWFYANFFGCKPNQLRIFILWSWLSGPAQWPKNPWRCIFSALSGWWLSPTLMVNILLIMVNIWLMMVNNIFWLVVEPYPSEKWWSESQLGLLFPTEWKVIKFMFQSTNQLFIEIPMKIDIKWPTNADLKNLLKHLQLRLGRLNGHLLFSSFSGVHLYGFVWKYGTPPSSGLSCVFPMTMAINGGYTHVQTKPNHKIVGSIMYHQYPLIVCCIPIYLVNHRFW